MLLRDIIKGEFSLRFIPLTSIPPGNDPATWEAADLELFQSCEAQPEVISEADNVLAIFRLTLDAQVNTPCTVVALGVVWGQTPVAVAYVEPQALSGKVFLGLNVQLQVAPWET